MEIVPPQTLGEFFTWLGSSAVIGFVMSWMLANWAWFGKQSSGVKVIILMGVALGMALVSMLATTYVPAGVVAAAEPYYKMALTSLTIVLAALGWNWGINKREERTNPPGTSG